MNEEQIIKAAEEYANNFGCRIHSREDYELVRDIYADGLSAREKEISRLQESLDECRRSLFQLHNPWISVEDRLPEGGKDILLSYYDGTVVRLGCVRIEDINFIKNHIQSYRCWMETPKPELKKGE